MAEDPTSRPAARTQDADGTGVEPDRYRAMFRSFVNAVAASHEMADPWTAGHQQRVASLAVEIGRKLGIEDDALEGIAVAAALHDIGKVAVPGQILTKPGPLHPAEFELVRLHPQIGHDIVVHIDFPWPIADTILQHHERMDGSGYPNARQGEEILLEARIVAVADTVETIAAHRPYKPAQTEQVALETLQRHAVALFDPTVVAACVAAFDNGFSLADVPAAGSPTGGVGR